MTDTYLHEDSRVNDLTLIYEEWVMNKGYTPTCAEELVLELGTLAHKLKPMPQFNETVEKLDRDIDWLNAYIRVWDHVMDTIDRAES